MPNKQEVIQRMCATGILPVFRTNDLQHLFPATKAFYDAGITCIEYTTTMPNVMELLRQGRTQLPDDLLLGAGTITDGKTVDQAVEAGATFIASPAIYPAVIEACQRHGVVSVVGAMTPTEIARAIDLGADVIKVFPAGCVGPGFFTDILGPYPGLHMMAAGGMTFATIRDYVAAGAEILTFLGNGLESAAYAAGDCETITRTAKKWVDAVQAARK